VERIGKHTGVLKGTCGERFCLLETMAEAHGEQKDLLWK
jgi:hypothetical protein